MEESVKNHLSIVAMAERSSRSAEVEDRRAEEEDEAMLKDVEERQFFGDSYAQFLANGSHGHAKVDFLHPDGKGLCGENFFSQHTKETTFEFFFHNTLKRQHLD